MPDRETVTECVARALFRRDVEEDVCDGTWEENVALHERIVADARAAIDAYHDYIRRHSQATEEESSKNLTETIADIRNLVAAHGGLNHEPVYEGDDEVCR